MLGASRKVRFGAALAVLLIAGTAFVALRQPGRAEAHPLGNFTINHYSRIELSASGIHVRYVIDMAEIPTYQERGTIDTNGDGQLEQSEQDAYIQKKAENLRQNLELKINGSKVELQTTARALSFLQGQGGLATQRMVIDYAAPPPSGWRSSSQQVDYRDENYSARIGWREIVVQGLDGVDITTSSVPSQDISHELLAYPKNNLSNPLNVQSASFEFKSAPLGTTTSAHPVTQPHVSSQLRATRGNPDSTLARYANLIAKDKLSVDVIILALLAAIGFGALHALSPGHGKTIVGAYLVGSRGTWRHALLLALIVTVTHTSSVYALGFVTLYLSSFIVPEKLYPWLSIASGGLVLAMGFTLLVTRLRASRVLNDGWTWLRRSLMSPPGGPQLAFEHAAVSDRHEDDHHHHDGGHADLAHPRERDEFHAHNYGFGRAHSHLPPNDDGSPLTWRGLVGLGIFGGLLPCPSAIVVMVSAIALHRVAFGLLLIVAFSLGLAGVLTSIGLLLVYAGAISRRLPLAARLSSRLGNRDLASFTLRAFPAGSAAAVVIAGLVLTAHGLAQQGFL